MIKWKQFDMDNKGEYSNGNKALLQISSVAKTWADSHTENNIINVDVDRCNRTYIRFRTEAMNELFPLSPGTKSGWNTENHYFYEIVNRTGISVYIQLAISSKEMPDDQIALSDRINEYYPSKFNKPEWQWRTPFKTSTVQIDAGASSEAILEQLDKCLQEIRKFEMDLKSKLQS